jgi:amino acid transporter
MPKEKLYELNDDINDPPFSPHESPHDGTPLMQRMVDSFKPISRQQLVSHPGNEGLNHGYDVEAAAAATAHSPLARRLKGRHLQMIAIGGSIGN